LPPRIDDTMRGGSCREALVIGKGSMKEIINAFDMLADFAPLAGDAAKGAA
jgi:hypothetical protein